MNELECGCIEYDDESVRYCNYHHKQIEERKNIPLHEDEYL